LTKAFSASIEMVMWFLSFMLVTCWIMFIYLCMLNHPWIPGIRPACKYFIENFCIYGHQGSWSVSFFFFFNSGFTFTRQMLLPLESLYQPKSFFFVTSLSDFGIRIMLAL
jgi:hypothetical protein